MCLGNTEFVFTSKGICLHVNELCNGNGPEKPSKNKCDTLLREADFIMKVNLELPVSTESTRPGETLSSGVYFGMCHAKHDESCLPSALRPRAGWICLCMGEKGAGEGLFHPPLLWIWRDSVSYSSEL